MAFKKIDPKLNLPEEEEKILEYWKKNNIFDKSLEKDSPKGNFVFFEGPPTANGMPGLHHILARAFKDMFARYKTMQGYNVKRKAGWDTHGLPVELQVEKSLGISGKGQIENIVEGDKKASIEKFNKLCKESVWTYKEEWEKLTERMGYWVDMKDPYVTYDPKYIESLWYLIGEIDKKGLLYQGHKIVPFCPRCGTALSSHEVAQGYKLTEEESVYVKIKSTSTDMSFLVWTTTPWTLAGNAALAFGPAVTYVVAEKDGEKFILAKNRVEKVLPEANILEEMTGDEVVAKYTTEGFDYEPIYEEGADFAQSGKNIYKLISADYVSDSDGTGIVHIAPSFGQDDYLWGYQKNGIKVLKTVDEKGIELAGAGKGRFVKSADNDVKADLEARGILFRKEMTKHDYPFCWRCDTPLLYFARDSWYIAMSKVRDQLVENNKGIKWNPDYIKNGRFGNWLENIEDWALSRDRYWGTPLPIWVCEDCGEHKVVTTLEEVGNVEPHKPYIDEVEFVCKCGGKMKRTPEVMDVWLDSGCMPFAQYHFPFENKELQESQYPADFICEGVDQTRGWFYTLLAMSTLIKGDTSFKNVICTGLVLDSKGKKMSKSKGNIVSPKEAFDKYGADLVRFFFYTVNQPGEPKLYNEKEVITLSRNLFMTLWNVYSFFMMYASIDNFVPTGKNKSENVLDQWILAKLQELVNETTKSLDNIDPYKPANQMIEFINELSTWYVRRSRRRFWKSESDTDKNSAYETLYFVLVELAKLLAPFTPMFAEAIYQELKQETDAESVHLLDYPAVATVDTAVLEQMAFARKVVEEGLAKRAEVKIKIRQPLSTLTYAGKALSAELEEMIAEEVNVKGVVNDEKGELSLDTEITKELKIEGMSRDIIRNIQALRKNSGFQVEDRIVLNYDSQSAILTEVMTTLGDNIAKEVLATGFASGRIDFEGEGEYELDGEKIWIGISRAK